MSDTVAALPLDLPPGVEVVGPPVPASDRVLTRRRSRSSPTSIAASTATRE